tara:strand:+ start:2816 stop:4321 length:1506 start_codon:yes stop_codon:yes gene_type:complete
MKQLDLLVIAPGSANLYQDLSEHYSAIETNIWAGLLANAVRVLGKGVQILDVDALKLSSEEAAIQVKEINPKLVLLVPTGQNPNSSSASMSGAIHVAEAIRNISGVKLAIVGPHVNALPKETLEKHDCLDIVLTNEGVYALRNLVQSNLESDLSSINGICFRDNNEVIINPAEKIVPQERLHIDLPGVAYDLMPSLDKYRTSTWHCNYSEKDVSPFASIYTSLGCIYKCEFCMINIINRTDNDSLKVASDFSTFRYWDPDFTISQLDYLANQGVKQIKIADEMWVLKPKHFMTLCDKIIERQYDFNIWAYTRIDTIKPQYLEKLKQAGVNWLAIGIEAGNQEIRREITKGKFEDINIREVVGMIKDADINVGGNFIFGLGHDTWDTMQETLNLAFELNTEMFNCYAATSLPGSPLYQKARREQWELPETYSGYGFLSYDHIPSRTYSLTAAEVIAFRDYAFHTYLRNPRFLNMIHNKFGPLAVDSIKNMTKIKLKRKLLGD